MPYFVIFAKIISDPNSSDCFTDLQLLRKVVLYFLQMHSNHQSAKKLEKVAETFTRLAEAYVRHSMQGYKHTSSEQDALHTGKSHPQKHATAYNTNAAHSITGAGFSDFSSDSSPQFLSMSFSQDGQALFNFDDLDSDPMTLLNFFSPPGSDISSIGNFMTSIDTETCMHMDQAEPQLEKSFSGIPEWPANPLIRGLENIAQNYGLDGSFDWFSWDQYDN
jgi:hypothetical protein